MFVDGHLDLAQLALDRRRDLTADLETIRAREQGSAQDAMVSFPELRQAGIGLVFGTIFTMPFLPEQPDRPRTFSTPEEARDQAVEQLELYERWEREGLIRIIRYRSDLDRHLASWRPESAPIGLVLLMEGADPLVSPADLDWWVARGLRVVGLAWKATRYAGGTGMPGPLTSAGFELVEAIAHHDAILDVSHLAEESFWQAIARPIRHVVASHSNARAIVPSDRHLSDAMIEAVGEREGILGLVMASSFLKAGVRRQDPKASVTLAHVGLHADHVARIAGWGAVAIGSDFDGGFGRQGSPLELERGADFARIGDVVPPEVRSAFLGENWLRLLARALPREQPAAR